MKENYEILISLGTDHESINPEVLARINQKHELNVQNPKESGEREVAHYYTVKSGLKESKYYRKHARCLTPRNKVPDIQRCIQSSEYKKASSIPQTKGHEKTYCGEKMSKRLRKKRGYDRPAKRVPQKQDSGSHSKDQNSFVSTTNLQKKVPAKRKNFQCAECGKSCKNSQQLTIHQRIHTGERPYKCLLCEKAFRILHHLTGHYRTHTGEKPYACAACGRTFAHTSNLSIHQRIHTDERPYACSECEKSFRKVSDLDVHRRTHSGEKPYQCTECEKRFRNSHHLKGHLQTHKSDRTQKQTRNKGTHVQKLNRCHECGKYLLHKYGLVLHQRLHTGEKPCKCSECGKAFVCKSALVQHQRVHTGEKPYKCADCGKDFREKSALNKHHRIHSGVRPYQCLTCKKSFIQNSHLAKHQKTHQGRSPAKE
ncbi:zinc finger protein 664-like isoform X2 [Microcaecilia unicolor]|uniref:Zinc finger protein 664-like isoform X2 n=1 Tax=Microcaecilia unicolor TaxID=1415580 RepID=A0A6P7XKH7_9AMPH|nr:zinc finger protein 664-like isoform X2 [Microcaecilia unicolor]